MACMTLTVDLDWYSGNCEIY